MGKVLRLTWQLNLLLSCFRFSAFSPLITNTYSVVYCTISYDLVYTFHAYCIYSYHTVQCTTNMYCSMLQCSVHILFIAITPVHICTICYDLVYTFYCIIAIIHTYCTVRSPFILVYYVPRIILYINKYKVFQ